jgi:hypothetical protein
LMNVADMAMYTYIAESTLLRVEKMVSIKGEEACAVQIDMMRVMINEAAEAISKAGKDALYAFVEGDEQRMMLMGLKRFTKVAPFNTKDARRNVAQQMIDTNQYCY